MKKLNRRSLLGLMSTSFIGLLILPKLTLASGQPKWLEIFKDSKTSKEVLKGYFADPEKIRALGLSEHSMTISNSDTAKIQSFELSSEWLDQKNYHALNKEYKASGKIVSQTTKIQAGQVVINTKFDSPESMIEYYLHFSAKPGFFDSNKFLSQGFQVTRIWS
jgi:hypothetical protein